MGRHWIEHYRSIYDRWWEEVSTSLAAEKLLDGAFHQTSDELTPMSAKDLRDLMADFPRLQPEVQELLTRFGAGPLRVLGQGEEPSEWRVFTPQEVQERVTSVRQQAEWELEILDEVIPCDSHGSDLAACATLLRSLRDHPGAIFPLMGAESPFDFLYVWQGPSRYGQVGYWYHDYPICELLDGTGMSDSLEAYGEELLIQARACLARWEELEDHNQ